MTICTDDRPMYFSTPFAVRGRVHRLGEKWFDSELPHGSKI